VNNVMMMGMYLNDIGETWGVFYLDKCVKMHAITF